jgi:6-linalyl-2-O,3-dimethylflaviolin/7-geranyloxy-5-hydroxy-2-methoxy-3-methylnaphthalene-1,4-dione synthase
MVVKPPASLDIASLFRDIQHTARVAEVPCQADKVRPILEAYQDYFTCAAVALRTTNKPPGQRELSVRYIDIEQPHDPYAIALEHGFLTETGHPIDRFFRDVDAHYPILGYGIDLGVGHGFEKVWPLFSAALPIEDAYALPSMPASVQRYDDYFKTYDLRLFSLFAIDYWHKTMNIYFPVKKPGAYPPDRVAEMIADLGCQVPDDEELALNAQTGIIYLTFSWDSDRCERLSFGVPHVPKAQFPTHLDPVFARLFDDTPVRADEARGAFMTAYAPDNRDYLKIEIDYTGTMFNALGAAIQVMP